MTTTKKRNVKETTTMTTDDPTRRPKRDRHVARSARILSTGLSATAILGITAAFGAADRAESMSNDVAPAGDTGIASTPSALAPLGAVAPQTSAPISQFPSPEGTITLPTGGPAGSPSGGNKVGATSNNNVAPTPNVAVAAAEQAVAPGDTVAPIPQVMAPATTVSAPAPTAPTTPATVAPIAPAEPPVELTLPPAPSNGSSGGSR